MEERRLKGKSQPANNNDEDIEIGILVTAKKMGLSFEELNMLTLDDYIAFTDKWVGSEKEENVRMATQEDIDRYMG